MDRKLKCLFGSFILPSVDQGVGVEKGIRFD